MKNHKTGCLVCGGELHYFQTPKKLKCEKCGGEFESEAACLNNHYICDKCHRQTGFEAITAMALQSQSNSPIEIAEAMMLNDYIHMHGPEHHYLIIAALLAAYKNAGGEIDLEKALAAARQRSEKVPGGICGLWGSCGAGIGAGIFVSIISGATPLSEKEWSLANKMTSLSLASISENGGPRCCKRDVYLSILAASAFVKEHFGVEFSRPPKVRCRFFHNNPTCRKQGCPFFKAASAQENS